MDLLDQLHRGNTRANRDYIAAWVGTDPDRFSQVMRIYLKGDRREAQLAAGVLFCILEDDSDLLQPWLPKMIARMRQKNVHPAVRRVVLRALMEIDAPRSVQGQVVDACFTYLADPSEPIAIRVFAMGAIARIAQTEPDLWHELEAVIQTSLPYSTGAFHAHARKVLKRSRSAPGMNALPEATGGISFDRSQGANMTTEVRQPALPRINSIDIIRGAVMVLMAIDHVRVFAGVPAGGPTYDVFFTRWITHFCAPAFLFLAGTSAFLYGRKYGRLPRFLITRGIWLIFLELTFLRLAWTFNVDFASYEMAGVIWVIGWCMIIMAVLVYLSPRTVGIIGLVIIFGHNVMDPFLDTIIPSLSNDLSSSIWKIMYLAWWGGPIEFGPNGPSLIVLYSIIPWIGVMAAGYGFGTILLIERERRDRMLYAIGIGCIALFLVLRGFNIYGDPRPWVAAPEGSNGMPGFLAFLNTTKYPASLSFLLMTLGPTIALIPVLERVRGTWTKPLTLFGRVPFFFYVLHIPMIHLLALLVSFVSLGEVSGWLFENHPMGNSPAPDGYMWSLGTLYLVWGIAIVILYYACVWYADLKTRRTEWWLRYL